MENIEIKFNEIEPLIFKKIRDQEGFIEYDLDNIIIALKNSLFTISIHNNNEVIAIGRVVGDGVTTFFLKDIIVIKKYRNKNYGNILLENILQRIYLQCCNNAYIGLMSTVGNEGFYEKFGFIKRPTAILGSGMVKYYGKNKK